MTGDKILVVDYERVVRDTFIASPTASNTLTSLSTISGPIPSPDNFAILKDISNKLKI